MTNLVIFSYLADRHLLVKMRINLIGNFGSAGLNQDAALLRGLLTNQFPDVVITLIG